MRYIKIENNNIVHYSIEQLFIDHPDAIIFKESQMPNETLLKNYNVYPLITEPQPELKEDETVEEGVPIFKENEWHQTWVVRKLNIEEIEKLIESKSVNYTTEGVALQIQASFFVEENIQTYRYNMCRSCPSFTMLKTCKECGCVMPLKIKIANVSCPLNKWTAVN